MPAWQSGASVYATAGVLPGLGVLLWFVNRALVGKPDEPAAHRLARGE